MADKLTGLRAREKKLKIKNWNASQRGDPKTYFETLRELEKIWTEINKLDGALSENVYKSNGYENRREYLVSLSDKFGVDYQFVIDLAAKLGQNEDFRGLVTELEEITGKCDF